MAIVSRRILRPIMGKSKIALESAPASLVNILNGLNLGKQLLNYKFLTSLFPCYVRRGSNN